VTPPSLLLAARNYPPNSGGTAHLLYELFKHFPEESLVAVTGASYVTEAVGEPLPFRRHEALVLKSHFVTARFARRLPSSYRALARRTIREVARATGAERILAHYPDGNFLVAAYQAAEDLGLPLAVYFDILWEERGDNTELAREFERRVVHRADARFAITPFAAEHLQQKHGVAFEVVPHVMSVTPDPPAEEIGPPEGPVVHFAGGVYDRMNKDAVERLAAVVMSERNAELEIFGPELEASLSANILGDPAVRTGFAKRSEMNRIQRAASVLYLPQAFDSAYPQMIRCNFPTKALEYMRAGRPILVHSPADSYLSSVARDYGFAQVVGRPDPEALRGSLNRLLEDRHLRLELVRAGRRFLADHDSAVWAPRFRSRLQ